MIPPRASKKTLTLSDKDYEAQWFICGEVLQFSREIIKTLPITQRKFVFPQLPYNLEHGIGLRDLRSTHQ
jgi:hypothetical protein